MVNQVHYLEMAIRNILGFIPTYFRPPYDDCQTEICQTVLKRMGYHIGKCKAIDINSVLLTPLLQRIRMLLTMVYASRHCQGYYNLTFFLDWQNDDVTMIEKSKKLFRESMSHTNPRDVDYIFLLHDTHYQTSWYV